MSEGPREPSPSWKARLRALPPWVAPLVALILLCIFTAIQSDTFLKPENLLNILRQWSFVGIIAIGMTFVITLGGIDLSVGSLIALVGGLGIVTLNSINAAPETAALWEEALKARAEGFFEPFNAPSAIDTWWARRWNWLGFGGSESWAVAIAYAFMLATGTIAGLFNGILIAKGRLAPFIATLGGLAAFRSLALARAFGGEYRSRSADHFGRIGQGGIPIPGTNITPDGPRVIPLLIPWPVLAFFAAAIAGWIILNRTRYGRYVVAIGCNERAAVYSAINVSRVKILTYTLIGFCTGVAGLLLASRMNSISSAQTGIMYELDVIAAVVIGGTRMRGGSGTIFGTIIGVLILAVIGNMLNLLQVSVYLQGLVKGTIIVIAVLAQRSEKD